MLADAVFGLAVVAPFALLLVPGGVPVAVGTWVLWAGMLACSAMLGGAALSRGASYATLAFAVACAATLGVLPVGVGSLGARLDRSAASGSQASAPGATLAPGVVRVVRVDVAGPLVDRVVSADGYPPLRLRGDLVAGESREALAWMIGPEDPGSWDAVNLEAVSSQDGSVGPLPVLLPTPSAGAGPFQCPGWAIRSGPSLERVETRIQWVGWLAALSELVLCVAIQRSAVAPILGRLLLLVVTSVLGCAAVLGLSGRGLASGAPDGGAEHILVIEGRRDADGTTEWVQIERSFGVLGLPVGGSPGPWAGEVVVADSRGPAGTERDLRSGSDSVRVVGLERDTPIDWRAPFAPGLRLLMPAVNTWGDFEAIWERDPGGEWARLGPWPLGSPLPKSVIDSGPEGSVHGRNPPGWCASALSQGTSVFVGRLRSRAEGSRITWVRLVGFRR